MFRFTTSVCSLPTFSRIVRGPHSNAITNAKLPQSLPVMVQPKFSRQSSRISTIFTKDGVLPIGPYSQAIKANGFIWVSGQMAASTNSELVEGTITEKTHKMCQNARIVVEAAGSSLDKVVKVNLYLEKLDDFKEINEVYIRYFPHRPARSCVEVRRLPVNATMEMDLIALE